MVFVFLGDGEKDFEPLVFLDSWSNRGYLNPGFRVCWGNYSSSTQILQGPYRTQGLKDANRS